MAAAPEEIPQNEDGGITQAEIKVREYFAALVQAMDLLDKERNEKMGQHSTNSADIREMVREIYQSRMLDSIKDVRNGIYTEPSAFSKSLDYLFIYKVFKFTSQDKEEEEAEQASQYLLQEYYKKKAEEEQKMAGGKEKENGQVQPVEDQTDSD